MQLGEIIRYHKIDDNTPEGNAHDWAEDQFTASAQAAKRPGYKTTRSATEARAAKLDAVNITNLALPVNKRRKFHGYALFQDEYALLKSRD